MSFNRRADQLAAEKNLTKSLKQRVQELSVQLAVSQANEAQPDEVEECDINQLNADLECAKFNAKKCLSLLSEMRGKTARDAFCTPEKIIIYNNLLCVAEQNEFEARMEVAYIEFKIYSCCYEGQQESKEEAIEMVNQFVEATEIDDKICNYFITMVMSGI